MSDDARGGGQAAVPLRPAGSGDRQGLEEVVRRLNDLLEVMSDVPSAATRRASGGEDVLAAARDARRERREQQRMFGAALMANPAWDILLEIFIASEEGRLTNVVGVGSAIGVPEATVIRCITHLVEEKLLKRHPDAAHPSTMFLSLTESAMEKMCDYFRRARATMGASAA